MSSRKINFIPYILLILYLGFGFFALQSFDRQYQSIYDQRLGGILKLAQAKYPNLSSREFAEILKAPSADFDLSAYGAGGSRSLVDTSALDFNRIFFFVFYIFGFLGLVAIFHFCRTRLIKSNVVGLLNDLERINHGLYDLKFSSSESHFSLLQNELYKVSLKLKQQSEIEKSLRQALRTNLENLSHQIKTPLTAITLLIENLSEPGLSVKSRQQLLSTLELEVQSATDLILLLLKLSKINSGLVELKPETIKLSALLAEAEEILSPFLLKFRTHLEFENCDLEFIGDYFWQREAFLNLLRNAIEHSGGEPVKVSARKTPSFHEIAIKNARPVPAEIDINRLFDRFYSGELSATNFGLGLNLAHAIIRASGGKIFVASDPSGTTFRLRYYSPLPAEFLLTKSST